MLGVSPKTALAEEWTAKSPSTPEEIASFYESSTALFDDINEWHTTEARRSWTAMLVHVATAAGARIVVDVGCGAGHDLRALLQDVPSVVEAWGVEPNQRMADFIRYMGHVQIVGDVGAAPVEDADLLVCCDVLEHVHGPSRFLERFASRARVGCLLFETTALEDWSNPTHLKENRGWHTGRVLEGLGWTQVDRTDRVRVWKRVYPVGQQTMSLLLCAYRSVSAGTMQAVMETVNTHGGSIGWRQRTKEGDALIGRSRSIIVTDWWRSTADDVFLMVDDDISFSASDADRVVELCRGGLDVVCGAYPTHDGAHLACRLTPGQHHIAFGPGAPPMGAVYAATGFMAVHRRVIDALVARLPLCHPNEPWSFYPFFQASVVEDPVTGDHEYLSEDYGFSQMAIDEGFKVWLDPQTVLKHHGSVSVSVLNMSKVYDVVHETSRVEV